MEFYIYTKDNEWKIAAACKQDRDDLEEHIIEADSLQEAIEIFLKVTDTIGKKNTKR